VYSRIVHTIQPRAKEDVKPARAVGVDVDKAGRVLSVEEVVVVVEEMRLRLDKGEARWVRRSR
jgi:hypothetical protein